MPQGRQGTPAIGGHISWQNRAFGKVELDLACGAIVIEGETHGISHLEGAHERANFSVSSSSFPLAAVMISPPNKNSSPEIAINNSPSCSPALAAGLPGSMVSTRKPSTSGNLRRSCTSFPMTLPLTPSQGRITRPCCMSCGTTCFTTLMGIAKLIFLASARRADVRPDLAATIHQRPTGVPRG